MLLSMSHKNVQCLSKYKGFEQFFEKKDNNQTILKGQIKGVAIPVPFFWPGSVSWKITVNYLATLEFGPISSSRLNQVSSLARAF